MDRILPVGTVVEARGMKLLLLGAELVEKDGKMVPGYYAVKYPKGFAGLKSLGMLAAEEITSVFASGYEDDNGRKYNDGLTLMYRAAEGHTKEETERIMEQGAEDFKAEIEKLRKKQ